MTDSRFQEFARKNIKDGIVQIEVTSWIEFNEFICGDLLDFKFYIWRGQRSSEWLLQPTLVRTLNNKEGDKDVIAREHLDNFKYATRGRRGSNPIGLKDDSEWWALGQHHGLATPLLDWTTSPFVAAFFAFAEESEEDKYRAIYALNESEILDKCSEFDADDKDNIIKFIKPLSDDNPRLVNQSGLFSWGPMDLDIEKWVSTYFKGVKDHTKLIKIIIPNSERSLILKALNRMNINHLTLFPDLSGASYYTNMSVSINNY